MMTSIQLNADLAAALYAKAAALGVTVDEYLSSMLLSSAGRRTPRMSVEEFDQLLDEEATSGPSPASTFSRSEFYSDHD